MSYYQFLEEDFSTVSYENFSSSSVIKERTTHNNSSMYLNNEIRTTSFISLTSHLTSEVPLFFSIISLTIRPLRIDDQQYFYSVDIHLNSTCLSKREANLTLFFQPSLTELSFGQTKKCFSPLKQHSFLTCENLTYGVHYTIDGFLLCGTRNISLTTTKQIYEIGKPKYVNSSSNSTFIETLFFVPGLFSRLIVQLTSLNKTCQIEYSLTNSPFYSCLFNHLPSAQWFILTYYSLINHDQAPVTDVTIVYTDLEDLNFSCKLNENNQQIDFSWSNLTGIGYNNLTISVSSDETKSSWIISCDPYLYQGICSTKQYRLEAGKEYQIIAKLNKILPNYNGEKIGQCRIKTNLSLIEMNSIRHEFLNETIVRLNWFEHPFDLEIRLKNVETNLYEYPIEFNRKMALFIHLIEANLYQLEFNISKTNFSSIYQITNYFIQTDFKKLFIEKVVRISDNTLIVYINLLNFNHIQILYCIQQIINETFKICSQSNVFNQLNPLTIYNISVTIQRNPYQNIIFWKKQTQFKIVNTNPSVLRVRPWKTSESCGVDLLNSYSIPYSIECISNERIFNCNKLECGCRYLFKIKFLLTNINSLCLYSSSQCDMQFNNHNLTNILFQTPLETIGNLRIISISSILKQIQVDFDKPRGCYDRLNLICELISTKQRKIYPNSTICNDLIPKEFYKISVEIKRSGWETVTSDFIQTQLISIEDIHKQITNRTNIQSIVISSIIGLFLLILSILLSTFIFIYRRYKKKKPIEETSQQSTTINNTNTTNKLNHILNQVNIYSHPKQNHSEKNIVLSRPIRIKDLPNEYEKLLLNNYYYLSEEFNNLQNSLEQTLKFAHCNQLYKNRYKDIIPYEHSRVKLIPIDECDPGYINANFISGLHNPREYIACQAPLKTTTNDHWKMIWEQNIQIIVMLTGLIERGLNKCERYWPMDLDQIETYGDICVCLTGYVYMNAYDLRYIQLKKNDEIRSIKHYGFKMWDDHTVPKTSDKLINFIRLIRSEYNGDKDGPILIHCSAGVGRSGTFIALDRLFQQFDQSTFDGYLDIYGTVLDLRKCRDKMVQNEHQYLFLYRCLKEEYEKSAGNDNYAIIADDLV